MSSIFAIAEWNISVTILQGSFFLKKIKVCLPTFPKIRSKVHLALYSSHLLWTIGSFMSSELLMSECASSSLVVIRRNPLLLKLPSVCSKSVSWSPAGIPSRWKFFHAVPTYHHLTWQMPLTVLLSKITVFYQALIFDSKQNLPNIWWAQKHSSKTATYICYLSLGE